MSALDAHVGKAVFQNVLRAALSDKTRILVTHALHFLPQVDYIYVISDGRVAEQGTYTELMGSGKEFSQFYNEFVSKDQGENEADKKGADDIPEEKGNRNAIAGKALMQAEERNTGAIGWAVYTQYIKAGSGQVVVPLLFLSMILNQGATVVSSYW